MSLDLFIDSQRRIAVVGPFDSTPIASPIICQGDNLPLKLFFMDQTGNDVAPYSIIRYQTATLRAALSLTRGGAAVAIFSTFAEIVPAVTAPVVTRVSAGSSSAFETQKFIFASTPGSGTFFVNFPDPIGNLMRLSDAIPANATAGVIAGAINPHFADDLTVGPPPVGVPPFTVAVADNKTFTIEWHNYIAAQICTIDVGNLQYLFGWSGTYVLSNANGATLLGALSEVSGFLEIELTPSGGAAVLMLSQPVTIRKETLT